MRLRIVCSVFCPNFTQPLYNNGSALKLMCLLLLGVLTLEARAQQAKFSQTEIDFFENKIRPILVEHCLQCHGNDDDKIRGGLYLTSRDAMLIGGDSGPAIVPGKPDESLLMESLRYEAFEMPPNGQLDDAQIETMAKWIEMGAPDPRETKQAAPVQTIDIKAGKEFWAFVPPSKRTPPQVRNESWPTSDIDRFILAKLEAEGISPAQDADRTTLIRRAYIALIGLPPTIEQIDAFVDDPNATSIAFDNIIDQLLQSRHFGERWGRHWLDVARFAESSGGGRSLMFPDAWRFRDYVIDSFNKDKPFDQFVREQIAGDLLPYDSHDQKIEQIIGTGLLALGPTNYEQQDKELLRMEVIDEQVDTIGRAFMGLTLGCARCHDHKFDPIPMTDYYALAGIFGSTKSLVDGNVSKYVERQLATEAELEMAESYRKQVNELNKRLAKANERLERLGGNKKNAKGRKNRSSKQLNGIVIDNRNAKLSGKWIESSHSAYFVDGHYLHDDDQLKGEKQIVFEPEFQSGGQYEVRLSYSPGGNRASNVPVSIDHQDGKSLVFVNQSQNPPIDNLFVSLGTYRFEANNKSAVTISTLNTDGHVIADAVQFLSKEDLLTQHSGSANTTSTFRGEASPSDSEQLSPELKKTKQLVRSLDKQLKELKKKAPRPVAVAMSVEDETNPRDGHVHIRGSVRNLGPVVPRGFISVCCQHSPVVELSESESGRLQLAHWIASSDHPLTARVYVNRVWRHLFGTGIVSTADNFGMMGQRPSHPELLDYLAAEFVRNNWSTKELIRHIMRSRVYQLASRTGLEAGQKDVENRFWSRANRRRVDAEVLRDSILFVSGQLDLTPGGLTIRQITQYDLSYKFDTKRRSVYVPAFRNSMLDLFEVFDFANPNLVTGHRNSSTLPTQALYLMNSPMVIEQSRSAAKRLLKNDELDPAERIVWVYRQTLGRRPTAAEAEKTNRYLQSFSADDDNLAAWASVYHSLFASLDFRYIE